MRPLKCPKCSTSDFKVFSAKSDMGYGESLFFICKCGFKSCYTVGRENPKSPNAPSSRRAQRQR